MRIDIAPVANPRELEEVRTLFMEYARSLDFSLCFQSFDEEVARLPGMYAPPKGALLLARVDGEAAGCAGLHELEDGIAEMKRLFVRPRYRDLGLGRALAQRILDEARAIGYRKMRLDTIQGTMDPAIRLYRRMGFVPIEPYRPNPIAGALYMELAL
ncbi:MAG TPA: GNAT family N-acetyltransferase [Thermoanaerobaculia bacterium]